MKITISVVVALAVAFVLFRVGAHWEKAKRKKVYDECILEAKFIGLGGTPNFADYDKRLSFREVQAIWRANELQKRAQCERDYQEVGFFSLR
jgi:hypothetical protein